MDWLLKLAALWISFDIVLIATIWYAATTIRPRWPKWWEQAVIAPEPEPPFSTRTRRSL